MSIIDTRRRPIAKTAIAAAAAASLAGGLYGAQAASAGSDDAPSVVRAEAPQGDDNRGQVNAADTPRIDEQPAPAPSVDRAEDPERSTAGLAAAKAPASGAGSDARLR